VLLLVDEVFEDVLVIFLNRLLVQKLGILFQQLVSCNVCTFQEIRRVRYVSLSVEGFLFPFNVSNLEINTSALIIEIIESVSLIIVACRLINTVQQRGS
jgi:hypothetical protein